MVVQLAIGEITAAMLAGDEKAFDVFYQVYFPRLYRYLLVLCRGDEEIVQDILQETMVRIVRYIKRFDDEKIFWNWLKRVLRTAFIDEVRKKKLSMLPLSDDMIKSTEDDEPSLLIEILTTVIDHLSTDEKGLITAKYYQKKSYKIIAKEQNLTEKAVESKLARIRQKIRKTLLEKVTNEIR